VKKQQRKETGSGSKKVDALVEKHNAQIKNIPRDNVLAQDKPTTFGNGVVYDPSAPVPLDDIPFFKTLALGTKLYKKGSPPTQVYQLRKSPQGHLFLYCKSTCEFVETTTVPVQFTPIG